MSKHHSAATHLRYSTVNGYFLQDDPETDPLLFDYATTQLGLKDHRNLIDHSITTNPSNHTPTSWQHFEQEVERLNRLSEPNISYKVLYLGRHGQGDHNVMEALHGTKLWNSHWAQQDSVGSTILTDAHLTSTGIDQARKAHRFWAKMITEEKIPLPQSYYTSPLDRCCATAQITFSTLDLPRDRPFIPVIKELLREHNGIHTCDRRSPKSYLQEAYLTYRFEPGFTENDELWDAKFRESSSQLAARQKIALDEIFTQDDSVFVSISSHSNAIAAILQIIGHRPFRLSTGGIIAVFVRAEVVAGEGPILHIEPAIPIGVWGTLP